ncbi:hypothetical protein BH10ACT9_BH10ACT9_49960 [soil metagenome]
MMHVSTRDQLAGMVTGEEPGLAQWSVVTTLVKSAEVDSASDSAVQ